MIIYVISPYRESSVRGCRGICTGERTELPVAAAIPVVDQVDLLDLVQLDQDGEVVPEGRCPLRENPGEYPW
jgi:hypothetical protein